MADIKPFRAVRPRADLVGRIAALPYDVYSRREAYEKVQGDDCSFLRIDRPETQFPEACDMYAPEVYEKARQMLYGMIREGLFTTEEKEAYYVYELVMDGRSQVGIGACASVDDYENRVIRNMRIPGRRRRRTASVMWMCAVPRPAPSFWHTAGGKG